MNIEKILTPLQKMYGPINTHYLSELIDTIQSAQCTQPRVTGIRVDLRYPASLLGDDMPCIALIDREDKITRFFKSLRAKLGVLSQKKHKTGLRYYPDNLHYVWVREHGNSEHPHYHILLLVNKDAFYHLGDYKSPDSLAGLIIQAWASAWGLHARIPGYQDDLALFSKVVHFPTNGVYHLNVNDPVTQYEDDWLKLVRRAGYLAKATTKDIQIGWRSFGTSLTAKKKSETTF
jgi:hypothetical protein